MIPTYLAIIIIQYIEILIPHIADTSRLPEADVVKIDSLLFGTDCWLLLFCG
jgi:hypothetical protein